MRISDWSSDVCSSDLAGGFTNNANGARIIVKRQDGSFARAEDDTRMLQFGSKKSPIQQGDEILVLPKIDVKSRQILKEMTQILYQIAVSAGVVIGIRSEENKSELQSLMRISVAVLSLKKKTI